MREFDLGKVGCEMSLLSISAQNRKTRTLCVVVVM